MKRKFLFGLALFFAAILVTVGMLALFPAKPLGHELSRALVDADKDLELHFEGYVIKLIAWDNDEIKVNESHLHRSFSNEDIDISCKENVLNVESKDDPVNSYTHWMGRGTYQSQLWLSLMQFEKYFEYTNEIWDQTYVDFYIYVPKGVQINVYANGVMNTSRNINFNSNWSNDD